MKIEGKGPGAAPAERLQAIQQVDGQLERQKSPAAEGQVRADRVEISAEGRGRAGSAGNAGEAGGVEPIPSGDPDRLVLVRQRVESGFYSKDVVQASVARAIIARGDHHN